MIRGVIFDMDGTMFDTEPISALCWKKAGELTGYKVTDALVNSFLGKNMTAISELLRQEFGPSSDCDAIIEARQNCYKEYIREHGAPHKEGLVSLLKYLREKEIPAAVSTSTDRKTAEMVIKKAGVYEYFDAFVYGDMVERGKPEPDIFWMAAEQIERKPEECLVVEDSPAGVLAGKAAGGFTIFIPDRMILSNEIKEGISAELNNLNEVITWIEQRRNQSCMKQK